MPKAPLFILLGIVLIVLGIAPLFIFVVSPAMVRSIDQAPFLKNMLQPVLCQSGQTLTTTQIITHTRGTGYSAEFSCISTEGDAQDVTGKAWLYGTVGFVVPLLAGIVLINVGARLQKGRVGTPTLASSYWQGFSPSQPGGMGVQAPAAVRLSQLKALLDNGLITQAEYETKRQEILREM